MKAQYNRTSLIVGISGLILQTGSYALVKVFAERARAHPPVPPEWVAYAPLAGVLVGGILLIVRR
jgi:hypothetical protein